jgi:hypothetical protein
MLRAALPRLVECPVHAWQRGRSVERCCWSLDVSSVMFTASSIGDEWMNE